MEIITISTKKRVELIEITQKIQSLIYKSNISEGLCFLYVPHTTAGIFINENADKSVGEDILSTLEKIVPQRERFYRHIEGNSDAHIKSVLVGVEKTILIRKKSLCLGTWQGIFFCEFDGPRERSLYVYIKEG